jgi:hypothetical protein
VIGCTLPGAGLGALLSIPKRDRYAHTTGKPPLAIAQLLINGFRVLRATSNNDATAMAPVLHTHIDASLGLWKSTGSHLHSWTGLQTCLHRLPVPRSSCSHWMRNRSSVRWRSSTRGTSLVVFRPSVPSPRVGFRGRDQEIPLRAEAEGRPEVCALIARVDVVEPIWRRPA